MVRRGGLWDSVKNAEMAYSSKNKIQFELTQKQRKKNLEIPKSYSCFDNSFTAFPNVQNFAAFLLSNF